MVGGGEEKGKEGKRGDGRGRKMGRGGNGQVDASKY